MQIGVHLSMSGPCVIRVYNTAGELVKTLHYEADAVAPKNVVVVWDGTNNHYQKVSSGVYIIHFMGSLESRTAKLLVIR